MANDRSIAISKPSEDGKRPAESTVPAVSGVVPWVFIVNHHEPAREALRQLCTSVGLAVETYATAEAFLAALGGRRPGCLLLELCLPGMGGFGLQREQSHLGPVAVRHDDPMLPDHRCDGMRGPLYVSALDIRCHRLGATQQRVAPQRDDDDAHITLRVWPPSRP